jgi:alpha-tubulin suppressor-like RCC1 family protein
LGTGTRGENRFGPVDVDGLSSGVTAIAAGGGHTCAVLATGALMCWGDNTRGQVGDGTYYDRLEPTPVTGLSSGVVGVTTGLYHTCALLTNGAVKCWGANDFGQLGDGTTTYQSTPVDVLNLGGPAVSISAGHNHTCAVLSNGAVKCWGSNFGGMLGIGIHEDTNPHPLPENPIGMTSGWLEVTTSEYHTCAISFSSARCWGVGEIGRLGDGTGEDYPYPVDVIDFP